MAFLVRFWGTRGSIPTPGPRTRKYGGNTSCVGLTIDETLFVCDGGTGLRELGLDAENRAPHAVHAHLFFSHMHWDHIQGFPFFVPAYSSTTSLSVYEIAPGDDRVQRLLHGQMRSEYFPVSFSDLGSRITADHFDGGRKIVDGVVVRCIEQTHPGRSFAFSFEKNGVKVVYATDNELDLVLQNAEEAERDPERMRLIPEAFVRFVEGADLLIADGQYTDEEYREKRGWGHARAKTVVDLAIQAGVKQCAIFHHDPMHSDDDVDAIVDGCRRRAQDAGSKVVVFGAREGLTLKF
jgi:phosphoribosyl 1,2-cyclic phosphodiesterase